MESRDNINSRSDAGDVIVVTGGCGFLGQHIVKLLAEKGQNIKEIRVFDVIEFERKLGKNGANNILFQSLYHPGIISNSTTNMPLFFYRRPFSFTLHCIEYFCDRGWIKLTCLQRFDSPSIRIWSCSHCMLWYFPNLDIQNTTQWLISRH